MIEWAIAAAQSAGIFERIFVSTDDVEITETVLPLGVEVPFKRPKHLSDDFATTIDVMAHAVNTLGLIMTAPYVASMPLPHFYSLKNWRLVEKS